MSTYRLLFQHYKNHTQYIGLVQNEHHHFIKNVTCSRRDIAEKLLVWGYTIITHSLTGYQLVIEL